MRRLLRDRLAELLVRKLAKQLLGSYDVGLRIVGIGPGVRVAVRINDIEIQETLWPSKLLESVDAIAARLVTKFRATRSA